MKVRVTCSECLFMQELVRQIEAPEEIPLICARCEREITAQSHSGIASKRTINGRQQAMNRPNRDPDKFALETARYVAAWIKAFGYGPTSADLAPVMGISIPCLNRRMFRAALRGYLYREPTGGYRAYRPVYGRLPQHLRERRPVIV